jgi:hypothetical protein
MPNNSNEFVIRFRDFEFFDKNALEIYFRKNLIHIDAEFKVNSLSIYVYLNHKRDDNFSYKVFEYVKSEIDKIINNIISLLENSDNKYK